MKSRVFALYVVSKYRPYCYFVLSQNTRVTDGRTDGQTDRQTDRQTELRQLYRASIRCMRRALKIYCRYSNTVYEKPPQRAICNANNGWRGTFLPPEIYVGSEPFGLLQSFFMWKFWEALIWQYKRQHGNISVVSVRCGIEFQFMTWDPHWSSTWMTAHKQETLRGLLGAAMLATAAEPLTGAWTRDQNAWRHTYTMHAQAVYCVIVAHLLWLAERCNLHGKVRLLS